MAKLDDEFIQSGGEFRIVKLKELFVVKGNPQLNKESFVFAENAEYPYFTRTVLNNGIAGYVKYLDEEHKIKGNCLAVGMLGMQFFYMQKDFYAGQFTKSVYPIKDKIIRFNAKIAQYFIAILNRYQTVFQSMLVRDFEKTFYASEVELPFKDGIVNTDYMENYMRELQKERVRELQLYLQATGLSSYDLTNGELNAIGEGKREWKSFRIGDLFDNIQQGARLTKQDQVSGDLPFVMSGTTDTGVVAKIGNSKNQFPSNSLTIDIFGNVFYRSFEFGASDDVGVYWNTERQIDKLAMLYMASSIQKGLEGKFSYGFKLRSSKSHDLECFLPVKNNEPDYEYMATYIKAIQKLVIKGVVQFADREMKAYKLAIEN